ncbi:plasmid partitioning protein RepB (plasmid) [Acuticoccus sp. MNP-M23]|uniref:plasmid partitioning protein RepB n=1 Tax=Acuticoccus sp. MNP-M23 TaxID=3072793 RepID=UPI0028164D0F|nr:plasmid partitioning protein RepB [Acuticoccus sp. MNP-M23]WMS45352.1 plasmid partitioning protein RepB [Acuticoccus sp. MNP-M23]
MTKRRLAMEKLLAVDPAQPKAPAKTGAPQVSVIRSGAVRTMGLALDQMREDRKGPASGERIVDLDPALCDPSFVRDRLSENAPGDPDPGGIEALAGSIAEGGQAVPILVRPNPDDAGRYQIAYGHRRWRACQSLGRPVRAIVRPLSDDDLVVAQGRENNARRDLSFIERAHFAAALVDRGLSRKTIGAALGVDKSELARLLAVANGLPDGLAEAIGPAPKAGRPRWLALVDLCKGPGAKTALAAARAAQDRPSDARFKAVFDAFAKPASAPHRLQPKPAKGLPAQVKTENGRTVITIEGDDVRGFGAFVNDRLSDLFKEYSASRRP